MNIMEKSELINSLLDICIKVLPFVIVLISLFLCLLHKKISLRLESRRKYKKEFMKIKTSKYLFPSYSRKGASSLHVSDDGNIKAFLEPLKYNETLILKGERGSGKTTLLKHIYNECYRAYKNRYKYVTFRNKQTIYLPIYIEKCDLQDLSNPIDNHLKGICAITTKVAKMLHKNMSEIWLENHKHFFKSLRLNHTWSPFEYKVLLCIDGFNELTDSLQEKLSNEIKELTDVKSVKIIISTRYMQTENKKMITYNAEELSSDNVKRYLLRQGINDKYINEEELLLVTTPLLVTKYFVWKKQEEKGTVGFENQALESQDDNLIKALGFVKKVTNTVDIFWNAYRSEIYKVCSDTKDSKLQQIRYILLVYIVPFMADWVENRNGEDYDINIFTEEDFRCAVRQFVKNSDSFIHGKDEMLQNERLSDLLSVLKDFGEAEDTDWLKYLEKSVAFIEKVDNRKSGIKYKFTNELDQIFFASVFLYNKDICSLYNKNNAVDPNKTTMGKCFRFFYSRLMCNFFDEEKEREIRNEAREKAIRSDLYYYGDGWDQNQDEAFKLSEEVINEKIDGDKISINWHIWNIFFIKLNQLKAGEDNTEKFSELFKLLEDAEDWENYYPIYDKVGFIFFDNKVYGAFKSSLSNRDLKSRVISVLSRFQFEEEINWNIYLNEIDQNRSEIMELFFEKAAVSGGYHYAFNKLGKIYENKRDAASMQKAFEYYESSYSCEPNDYHAIGKMLQFVNNGFVNKPSKRANILRIAEKAHMHVKTVSPIMECRNIQGYPLLLTSLGDCYYNKNNFIKAFEMYKENYLLHEADDFCYDKCRLMISFLAKKHSEECCIDSFISDEFAYTNYDEFRAKYKNIDEATLKVLNAYKELD